MHATHSNLLISHVREAQNRFPLLRDMLWLLAADAAVKATEAAQITLGGFGYAREYHVERPVREALLFRIVPVTPQMILSFIAGKALGIAKTY